REAAAPVEPVAPPREPDMVEVEPPAESPDVIFGELQRFLGLARQAVRTGDALPWAILEALVDRAIASLRHSSDLFWVASNPAAPAGVDYLAFHQARVAVLSLRIGMNLGYERARLRALGVAGALIDVGLWQLPDTVLRRLDALTSDEQALYRSHPRLSADLIRRWGPPSPRIAEMVLQHHEREQGQGFPQGLAGAQVDADAKILGLVDTYTGLTVPSSAKPRLRPHEAIRDIVKTRHEAFPPALIKALLAEISVFPPGTLVRLNTEEIGRVTGVNRDHPLRPRVEVLLDAKGQRLPQPKLLDLSEAPFLYITAPVAETGR
ncbi:MAG: HD-GYP domain-containing protein, partial [Candidatus Rokuibacteriota bacterium]